MKKSTFIVKCVNYWHRKKRDLWLKQLRKRNHNHDFSLITNDCVGGVICHDLGEQFRSPTVNLWIPNDQFLAFVQDLPYYLSCDVEEIKDDSKPYPVGRISPKDDRHIPIELNFEHYASFEEGRSKWQERSARVNYDRLFFIWHFFDDERIELIRVFDCLPVRKLIILHAPISDVVHYEVTNCYDQDPHHGKILDVIEKTGKRYLDGIDYIGLLNKEG